MDLPILPVEIWFHTISLVKDLDAIFSLCQTSKFIRYLTFDAVTTIESSRPVLLRKFHLHFHRLTTTKNVMLELGDISLQPSIVETSVRIVAPIFGSKGKISAWECGRRTLESRTRKIIELLLRGRRNMVLRISTTRAPVEYVFIDGSRILRWTNHDTPKLGTIDRIEDIFGAQTPRGRSLMVAYGIGYNYGLVNPIVVEFLGRVGLLRLSKHVSSGMCLPSIAKIVSFCISKYGIPAHIYSYIERDVDRICSGRKRRSAPPEEFSNGWIRVDRQLVPFVSNRLSFLNPPRDSSGPRGITEAEASCVRLPLVFPPVGCAQEIAAAMNILSRLDEKKGRIYGLRVHYGLDEGEVRTRFYGLRVHYELRVAHGDLEIQWKLASSLTALSEKWEHRMSTSLEVVAFLITLEGRSEEVEGYVSKGKDGKIFLSANFNEVALDEVPKEVFYCEECDWWSGTGGICQQCDTGTAMIPVLS